MMHEINVIWVCMCNFWLATTNFPASKEEATPRFGCLGRFRLNACPFVTCSLLLISLPPRLGGEITHQQNTPLMSNRDLQLMETSTID
jgi:hypothetical protein